MEKTPKKQAELVILLWKKIPVSWLAYEVILCCSC